MSYSAGMDQAYMPTQDRSHNILARSGLQYFVLCMFLGLTWSVTPSDSRLWAHPPSPQQTQASREVVIYHTSDMHGYILPHKARWHTPNPQRKIGGFVALAAAIEAEPKPYILLDSGDFFQGAPEGTLSKGRSVIKLMNALGYHASAIGNHEYDFGEANLIELAQLAHFPLLASNIQIRETGAPVDYAQPWALIEQGGVKVGVVGLATRETSTATLPRPSASDRDTGDHASELHSPSCACAIWALHISFR